MTEYQINLELKEVATNAVTSDYTDRELNGDTVTCFCSVTSQLTGDLYPRYTVSWKTSQEGDYIQAAFHFYAPALKTSFMRVAKIYGEDEAEVAKLKIEKAFVSGLKRGKALYDGCNEGPWSPDYKE